MSTLPDGQKTSGTDFWQSLGVTPPAADPMQPRSAEGSVSTAADPDRGSGTSVWDSLIADGLGHSGHPARQSPQPGSAVAVASSPALAQTPALAMDVPEAPAPDPAWATAERLAEALRSQFVAVLGDRDTNRLQWEVWRDWCTHYAQGDNELAEKVYDALTGWNVLGPCWRDERVNELHIRGVSVIAVDTQGMRRVPGFTDRATVRRTIEAIIAAQADIGAVVDSVGDSIVVRRVPARPLDPAVLVGTGALSKDLLARVADSIQQLECVIVHGPAAPSVVRAFASLIPAGSRVFQGPFGTLPNGSVAALSPLDADYVVGVRPGQVAEEMAAAGQIGALIANPRMQLTATVRLTVSGRNADPRSIIQAR